MNTEYLDKEKEAHINTLKRWSINVIKSQLWENHEDLHIDEVDKTFEDKNTWIDASLLLLKYLDLVIDQSLFESILFIPLSYSDKSYRIPLFGELTRELDTTPPSLGIYPKHEKSYLETLKSSTYILELSIKTGYEVFYREIKESSNEYFRILYIKTQS